MSIFGKIKDAIFKQAVKGKPLDVSDTVEDVVGGVPGIIAGQVIEQGVKAVTKPKKPRPAKKAKG